MTKLFETVKTAMNRNEEGQGLVEYALIISLVAVVLAVAALPGLSEAIEGTFTTISGSL